MDMDEEMGRLKVLLVDAIVFLISAFFSWRELKYIAFGKQADAKLVRTFESTEYARRGRTRQQRWVEYQFTDASGAVRKESDSIPVSLEPLTGPTVHIQYLNGSPGSSRLPANSRRIALIFFFASLAYMGFKFLKLVREGKR